MRQIIIFGAGLIGKDALQFLGKDNVIGFSDNNDIRWGQEYLGKKIFSPEDLVHMKNNIEVVIANYKYSNEIQQQLEELGIHNSVVFSQEYAYIKKGLKNVEDNVILVTDNEEDQFHEYLDFFLEFIPIQLKHATLDEFDLLGKEEKSRPIYIYSKNHHAEIYYLLRNEKDVTDIQLWVLWSDTDIVKLPSVEEWERTGQEDNWLNSMFEHNVVDNVDNYVKTIADNGDIPLFKIIELETINRCNSLCQFCPVNAKAPQRPKKYMADELFHKIIKELKELNFTGQVCMFSANEPFLDPNIVSRIQYAKTNLPNAKINITSNGSMLNLDNFLASIDYIDELIINNYSTERKLHDNLAEIVDHCNEHPEKGYQEKIQIRVRRIDEILSSRAGKAPNRKEFFDVSNHSCALPYQEMIVAPDGKIKLCSNDTLGDCILGDVSVDSLVDVWYGEKFNKLREELFAGRQAVEMCSKCDFFYII